jgi:hypothetical protein
MTIAMTRRGLLALLAPFVVVACETDDAVDPYAARSFTFGPIEVPANFEDTSKCVQISIDNPDALYVNQVELTTGPGFHHSNWFYVPAHVFAGDDGIYNCNERAFDQAVAGIFGGVFFAQSTQAHHEIQAFPPGMAIKVPPKFKLVASIHLLNTGDEPLTLTPTIGFQPLPPDALDRLLTSVTFEYHPLSLPPRKQSRFSVECDLDEKHQLIFGRAPDFKIHHALAHYHEFGTRLAIEAVKDDGTAATIYTTTTAIGDALGGTLDPAFDMTGYSKIRLTCDYYNNTDAMIRYGNGDGEMCIFNAFSDSPYKWAGGALGNDIDPNSGVDADGMVTFTRTCQVFATDADR